LAMDMRGHSDASPWIRGATLTRSELAFFSCLHSLAEE